MLLQLYYMSQICGEGGQETALITQAVCVYLFPFYSFSAVVLLPVILLFFLFCPPPTPLCCTLVLRHSILLTSSPARTSAASRENLKHDTLSLRWQYLHNIKQIASGNVFQCLSTPHGVAGGLASISGAAAKTAVRNGESGGAW